MLPAVLWTYVCSVPESNRHIGCIPGPNWKMRSSSDGLHMANSWQRLSSTPCGEYSIFNVRRDRSRSPRTGVEHDFFVIEAPDWVNVAPLTCDGRLVCVRQFRHGVRQFSLELPGGLVDAGETAAQAALREMREETGYAAPQVIPIGAMVPNSALQANRCHFFVAPNATANGVQQLDTAEDIEIVLIDPDDIPKMITSGVINNGIMIAAFYYYELYRRGRLK